MRIHLKVGGVPVLGGSKPRCDHKRSETSKSSKSHPIWDKGILVFRSQCNWLYKGCIKGLVQLLLLLLVANLTVWRTNVRYAHTTERVTDRMETGGRDS